MSTEILEIITDRGGAVYLFGDFYKLLGWEQHVFYREWCAFFHAKYNDNWFNEAELKDAVDVFWNEGSVFYQEFRKLDLENVIELACGRGRHVPHYINKAEKITLVDILEENMIICRDRFKDSNKIEYYKNNGYNLEKLNDDSYTSLFTYDSMVHFELMDIYEYLKDYISSAKSWRQGSCSSFKLYSRLYGKFYSRTSCEMFYEQRYFCIFGI